MKRLVSASLIAMIGVTFVSSSALGGGKVKIKETFNPWTGEYSRLEYRTGGGPPPWAPAHGYRKKHGRHEVIEVYRVPYGIDLGTCRRSEVGTMVGAVVGGAAGGFAGSHIGKGKGRLAATAGGAVLGVLIGGAIGHAMDEVDQACIGQVLEHAPDGRRITWSAPRSGTGYSVVPVKSYQSAAGAYCREYQTMATVGGDLQQVYGTACRQPDGQWKLMN